MRLILLFLSIFTTIQLSAKPLESNSNVVIITLSESRLDPIVSELYVQIKDLVPECSLHIDYLQPTRGEPSLEWVTEMEAIVSSLVEMDSLALVILVGDESWILFKEVERGRMQDAPLLLCGINKHSTSLEALLDLNSFNIKDLMPTDSILQGYPNASIVYDPIECSIAANIDMMIAQNPKLEQIVLITSGSYGGAYANIVANEIVENKYPDLEMVSVDGRFANSQHLTTQLNQLTSHRSLLFVSWSSYSKWSTTPLWEREARFREPSYKATSEPLAWDRSIGGYYADNSSIVSSAMFLIRDKLRGEKNVVGNSIVWEPYWHLNYNTVEKFGLNKTLFKGKVVYTNRPVSILLRYEEEIILLFVLTVIALIFFITKNRVHQLYARKIMYQNEELEKAVEQIKDANRLRTVFLDNLNHEVRTPLNALMGFSDILTQEEIDLEDRRLFAKLINENTMKLMQLFIKVNELSAIEAGAFTLDIKPIDISELLLLASQSVISNGAEVKVDLPSQDIVFEGDELRLLQVMHFLIENAIIHSGSDVVTIGSVKEESRIVFYVKDRGKGIGEEHQNRIFERLYKVDTNSYGTGLGLSTAKLLVEKMGGEIWLTSNPGEGSSFYFSFNI
ncbi:MAG: sensor histidine kinase [Bacteroidales bacterium]